MADRGDMCYPVGTPLMDGVAPEPLGPQGPGAMQPRRGCCSSITGA